MEAERVRVLVEGATTPLPMHVCVFHALGLSDQVDSTTVTYGFDGRDFVIRRAEDGQGFPLRHPVDCPTRILQQEPPTDPAYIEAMRRNGEKHGTSLGVAFVVSTKDDHALLTRRAAHMRTFANGWVPPGGHVDVGETIMQAARRELFEEVGLVLSDEDLAASSVLGLWESVYPRSVVDGPPIRHHMVVYVHVALPYLHSAIKLDIDPEEVGAAAWLSLSHISALLSDYPEGSKSINEISAFRPDGSTEIVGLIKKIPRSTSFPIIDTMTYGTYFALSEFLSKRKNVPKV